MVRLETPKGIFVSYRHADAASAARLLSLQLSQRFRDGRVFMDVGAIQPGADFLREIDAALADCAVLLALIGPRWMDQLAMADRKTDYVRYEIHQAAERGLRILPVLVDGAAPLRQDRLPADMSAFARLNAMELRHARYDSDVGDLFEVIRQARTPALAPPTPRFPDSGGTAHAGTTRTRRLLAEAASAARASTGDGYSRNLALIAAALAPIDAQASDVLFTEMVEKGGARWVVKALAVRTPWRAERIAPSIPDDLDRSSAMLEVVRVMAGIDLAEAERVADTIPKPYWRSKALLEVAVGIASNDPRLAEIIAQRISADSQREKALAVVEAATLDEWAQLERLLADRDTSHVVNSGLLWALRKIDPDQAVSLLKGNLRLVPWRDGVESIPDRPLLALALAEKNVDIGIRMAGKVVTHGREARHAIIRRVGESDPRRAVAILHGLSPAQQDAGTIATVAAAQGSADRREVARMFDAAERAAFAAAEKERPRALAMVARELNSSDPAGSARVADYAERAARGVEFHLAETLVDVAKLDPAYPEPPFEPWWFTR